jgi:hypothetical protein
VTADSLGALAAFAPAVASPEDRTEDIDVTRTRPEDRSV